MTPPPPDSRVLSSLLDPDSPTALPPSQRAAVLALRREMDDALDHAADSAAFASRLAPVLDRLEAENKRLRADLDATASDVLAVVSGRDPETWAWPLHGLRDALAAARAEVDRLRAERDDLMRVLEPLLIEVEPLRYEQRRDIEKACEAKAEWAKQYNARSGNSNEMWFYMTEYRRALESAIEPLGKAVREANEVYDRVPAGLSPPEPLP